MRRARRATLAAFVMCGVQTKLAIHGQAILITGAAGGLGSALALGLSRLGANLLLLDKDSHGLDRISERMIAEGFDEPGTCAMDLANAGPAQFDDLAAILENEYAGLDHLVHCAAAFEGLSPLDQVSAADWLSAVQVNLNAPWLLTTSVLPLLRRSRDASVTFVLDDPGKSSSAFWGAYGVSKAAARSLAEILAEELEDSGIRVNAVNPGPMRTPLRARAYLAENPASQAEPGIAANRIIQLILGN